MVDSIISDMWHLSRYCKLHSRGWQHMGRLAWTLSHLWSVSGFDTTVWRRFRCLSVHYIYFACKLSLCMCVLHAVVAIVLWERNFIHTRFSLVLSKDPPTCYWFWCSGRMVLDHGALASYSYIVLVSVALSGIGNVSIKLWQHCSCERSTTWATDATSQTRDFSTSRLQSGADHPILLWSGI